MDDASMTNEQLHKALAAARLRISELEENEHHHLQNEGRFRNMIDRLPVPCALNDENHNVIYLNQAFSNTFGYELNDMPTLADWWPLAYPDKNYQQWVVRTWNEHLQQSKQLNQPFEPFEVSIRCKNHTENMVLASATTLLGQFKGVHLVTFYDISQVKDAEKQLNRTVVLLENVINSTPDLIFVKNKKLQTILCNQTYADAVGKSRQQMYGRTDIENGWDPELVEGCPEKGIRGFMHDDLDALSGLDVHNPYDPANIAGKRLIFDTHNRPLINAENEIIGVLGIARDVTERRQTEDRLQESESRFRLIFESIKDIAVQGYDQNRRVIFWNQASVQLYGYSEAEAMGQKLEDLIIPEAMRKQVIEGVNQWIENNIPIPSGELLLQNKDGCSVPVYSSHTLQRTKDGRCELYCLDISIAEQKQMEEQLRHSQKMDALGNLTGGIAHDFNNMLAVIIGYAELLQAKLEGKQTLTRYIREISTAGQRAQKLTSKLLAFSRKQAADKKLSELNKLLARDRHMLEKTLTARIDLTLKLASDLWVICVDEDMLADSILNICINSMHAMPEGGELIISTQNRSLNNTQTQALSISAGDYVELSIKVEKF